MTSSMNRVKQGKLFVPFAEFYSNQIAQNNFLKTLLASFSIFCALLFVSFSIDLSKDFLSWTILRSSIVRCWWKMKLKEN